jgi:hypothetical protein
MEIERVQTGVRIEKSLLKVLKGLAEYYEITLGGLLEGIVLDALEGNCHFSPESLVTIRQLKEVYGLDYGVEAAHKMKDAGS